MSIYRFNFLSKWDELEGWGHVVDKLYWIVETDPNKEKLLAKEYTIEPIRAMTFEIRFLSKKYKEIILKEECENVQNSKAWIKFCQRVDNHILQCLKTTSNTPGAALEDFQNLKSFLWNKMSNALTKTIGKKYIEENITGFQPACFKTTTFVDDDPDGFKKEKRAVKVLIEGDFHINYKMYSLLFSCTLNPSHKYDLYTEQFDRLYHDATFSWCLHGPHPQTYSTEVCEAKQGTTRENLQTLLTAMFISKLEVNYTAAKAASETMLEKLLVTIRNTFYGWVREEKEKSTAEVIHWFYSCCTTFKGNCVPVNIDLHFKRSIMEIGITHWRSLSKFRNTDDPKDSFAKHLIGYVCGDLELKIGNDSYEESVVINHKGFQKGGFVTELKMHLNSNLEKVIVDNFKIALVNLFWEDGFALPPNTRQVLNELNATPTQKEIVAKDFENHLKGKSQDDYEIEKAKESLKLEDWDLTRKLTVHKGCGYAYDVTFKILHYRVCLTLWADEEFKVHTSYIKINNVQMSPEYTEDTLEEVTLDETDSFNEGAFVCRMNKLLKNIYMAIAIKKQIIEDISRFYGEKIQWEG